MFDGGRWSGDPVRTPSPQLESVLGLRELLEGGTFRDPNEGPS